MKYWMYVAGLTSVCILSGFLTFAGIRYFENTLFPVITDGYITDVYTTSDAIVVSGLLVKRRSCTLVKVALEITPKHGPRITIAQDAAQTGAATPDGVYFWGPYTFKTDKKPSGLVRVIGEYRCHILWNQFTEYGRENIE